MTLVSEMKELIDKGNYTVDLEEPTPLSKKIELIDDLKIRFYEDLLLRDVMLSTINYAWKLAEDVNGEDEALNSLFLHSVLRYIDELEEYYNDRAQRTINKEKNLL